MLMQAFPTPTFQNIFLYFLQTLNKSVCVCVSIHVCLILWYVLLYVIQNRDATEIFILIYGCV